MKLKKTDTSYDLVANPKMYNATKYTKLFDEFTKSGENIMEVTDWEDGFKKAQYAVNSINKAAKRLGYEHYHAHIIDGSIYLRLEAPVCVLHDGESR